MKEIIPVDMNGKEVRTMGPADFALAFQDELSPKLLKKIEEASLRYVELTPKERDLCIRASIKILRDPAYDPSGEHRLEKWETGWSQNLEALKEDKENSLIPRYFENDDIVRWKQEYVKPVKKGFDYEALGLILEWAFEKYFKTIGSVYEFGCGTGHHLIRLRRENPGAKLYGLDWAEASQKLIGEMVAKGILTNAEGKRFDFFNPDRSLKLDPGSGVYTVGALEQVGSRHGELLAYWIEQKPKVCVHVEPIGELMDNMNLVDFLAQEYYAKRNYLAGFIASLKKLEEEKKIKIERMHRTFLGGNLFTEYMVVVWAPLE
jgi:hypothetical protein